MGRKSRSRTPPSLSPVHTLADDDKPYLPDRGTKERDKPGWCSGPSYDPVTVVTRVQIPLRASPFSGRRRRLPGWCSGPSYDPVTVVTRVQIPLRASSFFASRRAVSTANPEPISAADEPFHRDLNQGVKRAERAERLWFNSRSGRLLSSPVDERRARRTASRHTGALRPETAIIPAATAARRPAVPSCRPDRRPPRREPGRRTSRGPSTRLRRGCRARIHPRARTRPQHRCRP